MPVVPDLPLATAPAAQSGCTVAFRKNCQTPLVPFGDVGRVWAVFIAYRDHRIFEMLELLHEDVIWVRHGPAGKTEYHGHDGIRQMHSELQKATGGYTIHLEDVTEDEPGLVVARGTVTPTGTHHGTMVTWKVQLLGGLVRRVETGLPG